MQDEAGAPLIPATPAVGDPSDPSGPQDPPHTPAGAPGESTHTSPVASSHPGRRRLFALLVSVAVVAYAADQGTKAWAVASLTGEPVDLLGSFLRLELIRNPGAAFSLGTGNTWLLSVIAVVVLVVVVRTSRRLGSTGWAWALGLLLGGALGNLTDRILREPGLGRGHVVDFLNYNGWFIGNVADIAIVGAAVLIALLALTGRGVDGTRDAREPSRGRHEATPSDAPRAADAGDG